MKGYSPEEAAVVWQSFRRELSRHYKVSLRNLTPKKEGELIRRDAGWACLTLDRVKVERITENTNQYFQG